MKKILTAVILASAFAASATTISTEYADHTDRTTSGVAPRSQDGFIRLSQGTAVGTFDIGLTTAASQAVDGNSNGYELGYSKSVSLGKVAVTPRVAIGSASIIDPAGGGFSKESRYATFGAEAQYALAPAVTGFVNAVHTRPLNDGTFASSNRIQVGAQYAVTKTLAVRAGLSHKETSNTFQNGFVLGASYSF